LPRNLADNPEPLFIVLNYNWRDDLLGYLATEHEAELKTGRLSRYSYFDHCKFRMAHAKNMAHRLGILEGAEFLANIDADNFTGAGFDSFVKQRLSQQSNVFLWSRMIQGEMVRGISGRMAVTKNSLLKSGGYDEVKFVGWGSDDKDFNLRLRQLGYEGLEIDPVYLNNGVPTMTRSGSKNTHISLRCQMSSLRSISLQ
jgi:hypothetical protein